MPKYFDIHSHLNFADYKDDFDAVISRLKETETHTIVVGTNFESSKRAVELADKYKEIYACIGIHPIPEQARYGAGPVFDSVEFAKLVEHPKVVAIGECGMDFYHAKKEEDYERQKKLFLAQINFALQHNKPLMIHARDAYEEILAILPQLGGSTSKLRGNIHFFAGSVEIAKRFFDIKFTVSFTGVITFTRDYDEVIKFAPLNMIMSETDAPYVAPLPYRGKRNEPSYVSEVVRKIAEIRKSDEETIRVALVNNALSMIG
ncbi:MAG: TatD family hydrolase [Candidatus Zambryskibacteria bacterium]|nr:TatD family hydrolase [Candidatus Zambryskibacteria bacterium]